MSLLQTQRQRDALADALGDTPETAIPVHFLRRGLADAYVIGTAPRFAGVIVHSHSLEREPWCFGTDPSAIWGLLRPLNDWRGQGMSPNVSVDLARPLAALIEEGVGVRVGFYGDVYHTLTGRVTEVVVPQVRRLGLEDIHFLAAFQGDASGSGFAAFEDLLTDGVAAGFVMDGRLVALAHTNAVTGRYADIGVTTDEAWRNRGLATAAGSIVARRVREMGRIPVWSAGEDNAASLRVAAKLGFMEVSRRVYLNARSREQDSQLTFEP